MQIGISNGAEVGGVAQGFGGLAKATLGRQSNTKTKCAPWLAEPGQRSAEL